MLNWDDPLGLNQQKPAPAVETVEQKKPAPVAKQEAQVSETKSIQTQSSAQSNNILKEESTAYADNRIATDVPAAKQSLNQEKPAVQTFTAATTDEIVNVTKDNILANAQAGLEPVKAEDKRVINGQTDINQLAPFKYPWAWKFYLNANKNHWTPLDINMTQDVHDYHKKLTDDEKHVYQNVLSYLTTSDILAMRNVGLAVMEKMSAPELQIYQARQVYEEALHTWTYQHCIETIGLDQGEIYNRYRVVPEINKKIQVANRRLSSVLRPDIDLTNRDEMENFVLAYMFFGAIFEGCWFYNGFSPIFALQRRGMMKGTAEQLQYIMRDEVMHCSFGIRVVKQIIQENNIKLDPKLVREMWDESEAAEVGYAKYLLRRPILGYSAEDHSEQFRYIANRRARQLQIEEPFPGAESRLDWLDEQSNLRKEKNFFETRVTEYQTGGALSWD